MAQCDTHYLENCRLCKSAPQNAALVAGPLPVATGEPLVHIPDASPRQDKPEILDPAARNAMLLATALDDVATMKGVVANLGQMLQTSKEKLAEAESTSQKLLAELTKAINEKDRPSETNRGRSSRGDEVLSDAAAHDTAKNA